MKQGLLVVISGPSGAGKSTICHALEARGASCSISTTTRTPREGEVNGRDYYFTTKAHFEEEIKKGKFAEHAEVFGNHYGTANEPLEYAIRNGQVMVMDVDIQGAAQIRMRYPEALTIFLLPPDTDVLEYRLKNRGTDSPEEQARRLAKARLELTHQDEYNVCIVNQDLDDTINQIEELIKQKQTGLKQGE